MANWERLDYLRYDHDPRQMYTVIGRETSGRIDFHLLHEKDRQRIHYSRNCKRAYQGRSSRKLSILDRPRISNFRGRRPSLTVRRSGGRVDATRWQTLGERPRGSPKLTKGLAVRIIGGRHRAPNPHHGGRLAMNRSDGAGAK